VVSIKAACVRNVLYAVSESKLYGEHCMASKLDLLKNVGIFSHLGEDELKVVARLSRYYVFTKGEIIYREGSSREELFIIKSGEVLICNEDADGSRNDLARFLAGESFGELELLDNEPRVNRAVAAEDSRLLIFPIKGVDFRKVLTRYPGIFALVLHDLLALIAGRIRSTNRLISEKGPWVQGLRRQLTTDKLTGLLNRTFLDEDFPAQLEEYGCETCVLVIKPDNFKQINDTFGHETGDRVLKMIADTIRDSVRESDIPARYRGDEFVVILPDTKIQTAEEAGKKVLSEFGSLDIGHATGGEIQTITVSIGLSRYPDARNCERLIQTAFEKMFSVRESGGGGIAV
jgi:diguanylate cyclase (GGDEF)-like protein